MSQSIRRVLFFASIFAATLAFVPDVTTAQSLGDIAKKEKKRRAENGADDVRVIDDRELASAESDLVSVTGVTAGSTASGEGEAPATSGSSTDATERDPGGDTCAELRAVEAEIARLKKTQQVTRVKRERRVTESLGPHGTRERHVSVIPEHTINAQAIYSERIAALNKRWVELRKTCSP